MTRRIEVTPASIAAFIASNATDQNCHLLFGLSHLSESLFRTVFDGLLNRDFMVEELIQLGGFTNAEAEAFVAARIGSWGNLSALSSRVDTGGYAYLTRTLGLSDLFIQADAANERVWPVAVHAGLIVPIGVDGYPEQSDAEDKFDALVLSDALNGLPRASVLPATPAEYALIGGSLFQRWARSLFGALEVHPLYIVAGTTQVPNVLSTVVPSVGSWLCTESMPAQRVKVAVRREAAVRSTTPSPEYTTAEIGAIYNRLIMQTLEPVGVAQQMAELEVSLTIGRAVNAALFDEIFSAFNQLIAHRLRVRTFLERALELLPTRMVVRRHF